jgi:hypothetical protein
MKELEDKIKLLEKQLEDEKRFRKAINAMLVWEKERNYIEVRGLKDVLLKQREEIRQLKGK